MPGRVPEGPCEPRKRRVTEEVPAKCCGGAVSNHSAADDGMEDGDGIGDAGDEDDGQGEDDEEEGNEVVEDEEEVEEIEEDGDEVEDEDEDGSRRRTRTRARTLRDRPATLGRT